MFTVAGVSILNGVMKARFANDLVSRVKVLNRNSHTDVRLIELPTAMDKDGAVAYLSTHEDFQDAQAQAVFADWATKRAPKEPKAPRAKKAEGETTAPKGKRGRKPATAETTQEPVVA